MPAFYYSSVAGSYTLVGGITSSATSITLDSVSGLPASTPYKVVLNPGESNEEIVKVTGVAGMSLTVVRGWNGTVAVAHSAGASVRHMLTAEDLTLSRTHEDATVAHGATGAVVGTTNTQPLTNKDLSSGTNTFPTSLLTTSGAQTVSNKNLTSGTNTFPANFATTDTAQTFTGKSISGGTNTFSAIPQSAVTNLVSDLASLDSRLDVIEADTGWKDIALTVGGWTAPSQRWQTRQIGNKVYLRGGLVNAGHSGGYSSIGTLDAAISPPVHSVSIPINVNTGTNLAVLVTSAGDVRVYASAATVATYTLPGFGWLTN